MYQIRVKIEKINEEHPKKDEELFDVFCKEMRKG